MSASVYKDDTAQTVADRVFRHANLKTNRDNKDKRKLLAMVIEEQINSYIYALKEDITKESKEQKK